MNHVHDSQETTPLEVAWQNFLREAGLATAVTASKYFDEALKARIAAELPNITKAVLNHPLDKLGEPVEGDTFAEALAPQPVAVGDVPEKMPDWFWPIMRDAIHFKASDEAARVAAERAWRFITPVLSRRVAEATEAKDKRIAELSGDRDAAIRYLTGLFKVYAPQCAPFGDVCGLISQVDNYVCGLKEQLAAAQAEVSRLSRPVDKESIYARWADIGKFISTVNEFASAVEPLLQSERNARESAERERDELREACNKYVAISNTSDENKKHTRYAASERHGAWGNRCADYIYATPADAVLAAFRAERAKMQA